MITTEHVTARVPAAMIAEARERWPLARELPTPRLLRFAIAVALGKTEREALALTAHARKIDYQTP